MTPIHIKVSEAVASADCPVVLTSGMVGLPVSFTLEGFDGLEVTAVFRGSGVTISVPLHGATETVVPWEVMEYPRTKLSIGVEGRLPDGTLVIPTTWADVGCILPGANASDDLEKPPTPTAYDRIMSVIGNMDDLFRAYRGRQKIFGQDLSRNSRLLQDRADYDEEFHQ